MALFDTSQHLDGVWAGGPNTVKLKENGNYVIRGRMSGATGQLAIDITDNTLISGMHNADLAYVDRAVSSSLATDGMDVGFFYNQVRESTGQLLWPAFQDDALTAGLAIFRLIFPGDVNLDGKVTNADLDLYEDLDQFGNGIGWRDFDRDSDLLGVFDEDDRQTILDGIAAGLGVSTLSGGQTMSDQTHWLVSGSTMAISGTAGKTIHNSTVRNSGGTVTWSGGNIAMSNASSVRNSGVFDMQSNNSMSQTGTGVSQFVNLPGGVLRKSGGTGNSSINVTYVHEGGSIDVQSGTVALNGPVQISEGATLLKTGGGALAVWGTQSHGAYSGIHAAGGSVTLFSDAGPAYPAAPTTGLKASGGAAVTLEIGQHLTSLHAGASSVVTLSAGGDKLLRTGTLGFDGTPAAPQGKLDLKDNAMIVDSGVLDDVKQSIRAGWDNTTRTFTGQGIGTSIATDCDGRSMALGYARRDDAALPQALPGLLGSEASSGSAVVVRWTRQGDADLDGDADGNDAARHGQNQTGSLPPGTGTKIWTQGDWDYDYDVDGDDISRWAVNYTGDLGGVDLCAGGSLMMAGGGAAEGYAVDEPFDASEWGDYSYNGIDLLLPGDAHPEAVEILRAMGYGVGIELTAMSARVVPEPGVGAAAVIAAGLVGRRRKRVVC